MSDLHVGDIGTVLTLTVVEDDVAVDISTATTKQILLRRPDSTVLTKTADFATDGSDGKIQYTLISGDLTIAGRYRIQGRVVLPDGTWSTDVEEFKVASNLA